MSDKTPEWRDFIPSLDGVEDVAKGLKYARGPDGRLNGNVPFDAGVEVDAEFVERLKMARAVDEEWQRSGEGEEPSMDEY